MFNGHQVLRLHLQPSQLEAMNEFAWNRFDYDFWRYPAVTATEVTTCDVRVTPEQAAEFSAFLEEHGIQSSIMVQDVEALAARSAPAAADPNADYFASYHSYPETVAWMQNLTTVYRDIAKLVSIGTSYENRTIWAVKVTGKGAGSTKPGIFYDGGIHAREWIAPATVSFILFQLVSQYGKDPEVTKLVDSVEWTIVPIFNVDGYQFTFSTNRMWRKTRMPNKGSTCIGTDPCRNSDYHWGEAGSSNNPCSDTYRGAKAFDQPEVLAIANAVKAPGNIRGYINFHSYSQLYMGPWSYTYTLPPDADYKIQTQLGQQAVAAIKASHGVAYKYGPGAATIYPASGDISDYNYGGPAKVLFAYCVELRDTGRYGFLLPPDQIVPTGEEIFASAKVMANFILAHPDARSSV